MEGNNQKDMTKMEKEIFKDMKPILKVYLKKLEDTNQAILENNMNEQNKIEIVKTLKIDTDKYKIDEAMSPEMEAEFKQAIIDRIKMTRKKEEDKLRKELDEARNEANLQCKRIIGGGQEQLKSKIKKEKTKLEEMKKELKLSKIDLSSIKKAVLGLGPKPEGRIFTMLDKERGQIIEKRKNMSREKRIIIQNIKKAEDELNEFNSKFGKIHFEGEKGIVQVLTMIYGKLADFSIFIQEDERDEELEKTKQEREEEDKDKNKPEQGERKTQGKEKDVNKKPEDKSKTEPDKKEQETKTKQEQEAKARQEQEAKAKQEQEAKARQEQEAKTKQEQEAKARQEQEAKVKQEQEAKARQEQEAKTKQEQEEKETKRKEPKMKYVANRNEYIIDDNEKGVVKLTSKEFSNSVTKKELAEIMKVSEKELQYVDTNAVHAWMKYDEKYNTHEAMKYLKNMLNPENLSKENRQDIEYDLTKIGKTKELSRARKREILEYANYAKEYNIANVKKGFRDTIREKMARVFNKNKLAENNRKLNERAKDKRPKQRENKLYKEMAVKDKYYEISQSITKAKESEIDGILEKARGYFGEGKISATEYNGIIYNANYRRSTINIPPQDVEPDRGSESAVSSERE